jgi:dihydropteroate synthase
MGVINLTPDSFSGDGVGANVQAAVDRARQFEAEGADIIDLGAESTRPGAQAVSADEELGRVLPVLERLKAAIKLPVSVDTYKAAVARRAVEAGAALLNNVQGPAGSPAPDAEMPKVATEAGVPLVVCHNHKGTQYSDLMSEVKWEMALLVQQAREAGVPKGHIIVDPGLGFGKTPAQSLALLRNLDQLKALGQPLLVGPSRKSMIGAVLEGLPPDQRLEGTAAAVALAIGLGADIVRVHDVRAMARVARLADAVARGWAPRETEGLLGGTARSLPGSL